MPAALTYPGVYVEELPSGVHTITGVATSITTFIGWAPQGPVDQAVLVESWSEFASQFGNLYSGVYLGYAVNAFFANGGSQAYVIRLVDPTAAAASLDDAIGSATLYASNPGTWGTASRCRSCRRRAARRTSLSMSSTCVPGMSWKAGRTCP